MHTKLSLRFLLCCFWPIVADYFKSHQRITRVRYVHAYVALAATAQFILAPFIAFLPDNSVSHIGYHFIATWLHMLNGLVLLCVGIAFSYNVVKRKGVEWLFPYIFGQFSVMKKDAHQLMQLRLIYKDRDTEKETRMFRVLEQLQLPKPHPRGLAAVVQGLGIVLLLLLTILGFFFFVCWIQNLSVAWDIITAHRFVAILFFFFYLGHGGMGLLHMFNQDAQKRMKRVQADSSGNTTGTESCHLSKLK